MGSKRKLREYRLGGRRIARNCRTRNRIRAGFGVGVDSILIEVNIIVMIIMIIIINIGVLVFRSEDRSFKRKQCQEHHFQGELLQLH